MRVVDEGRATMRAGDALENTQRRDDERVVRGDERRELRVGRAIDEEVREPVGAGVDRVARAARGCRCARRASLRAPCAAATTARIVSLSSVGSVKPYVCPSS